MEIIDFELTSDEISMLREAPTKTLRLHQIRNQSHVRILSHFYAKDIAPMLPDNYRIDRVLIRSSIEKVQMFK